MERIDAFIEEKKISPQSKESYRRELMRFSCGLQSRDLSRLSPQRIEKYFSRLAHTASLSTFARAFSVVRSYYAYLLSSGVLKEDPMAHLQARAFRPRLQQYLSQKELSRLLETRAPGLIGMRDRAMLSLLCETGLKASELVGLERDGFDPDEGCLLCGEGKRARCLPLSTSTQRNLREYLAVSDLIPEREKETALFVNHRGKRITRQGFWKILRNKGYECQLSVDLTPQLLRHSMAYHRLREGQSPESVRKLLGNEKIASLRGYIKAKEKGNGYF